MCAYRDFIAPMKAAGLEFCFPAVSAGSKQTSVRALPSTSSAGAAKLMPRAAADLRNGFYLTRRRTHRGGEPGPTTAVRRRSRGCSGSFITSPASATRSRQPKPACSCRTRFSRISSGREDAATLRGKFEDELVKDRPCWIERPGDSVLVMNESFASTTLRDALFVGERVLDRMTALGICSAYT